MITFIESKEESMAANGEGLDSQLWHACAGSMVQMPSVNSKVYYFPQGHSEHASGLVDFRSCPRVPAYIPCRLSAVKFMADRETDEVFAKIRLVPINVNVGEFDDDAAVGLNGSENHDKPTSFAKTLTQSDANNGGGFSVPRYCAETIFPRLDYSADPPVQTILAKDVHGETWRFRHIYRGTPRRHLLTTGWSSFVNQKKLCAGDSIVFMRAENEDLCLGIRRAKRGIGGESEMPTGWNSAGGNSGVQFGDLQGFMREDGGNLSRNSGRVKAEDVIEAATLAARGQPFDVVYYPQSTAPEFFVKASQVKAAVRIRWAMGMRFKMAFGTEDSSRISWFMGTISSVQVADPIRWPDSPWRLLQVSWDEPDLLQNVKQVNPWSVELVSNVQGIPLSSFSPPRKKIRLQHQQEFPFDGQILLPPFSSNQLLHPNNPFAYIPSNISPAGMQGARHAQYGFSIPHFHPTERPSGFTGFTGFTHLDPFHPPTGPSNPIVSRPSSNENISSLLPMRNSTQELAKPADTKASTTAFLLFGKPILTEQQISANSSHTGNSSSEKMENTSEGSTPALNQNEAVLGLETGHCKVFIETEDVGRTLDLSLLSSYEELYIKLQHLFSIEVSEMKRIVYRDAMGAIRQLGDEPFSDFLRTARRLMILGDSSIENMDV